MDRNELFTLEASQYGKDYQSHLLEQYKLYVRMANKVSARRQAANSFFLTVNTAVIAFLGLVAKRGIGNGVSPTAEYTRLGYCDLRCRHHVVLFLASLSTFLQRA